MWQSFQTSFSLVLPHKAANEINEMQIHLDPGLNGFQLFLHTFCVRFDPKEQMCKTQHDSLVHSYSYLQVSAIAAGAEHWGGLHLLSWMHERQWDDVGKPDLLTPHCNLPPIEFDRPSGSC